MNTVLQDLHHALRLMRRAPGFTLAALATLALAVGVNTAVFSGVYGVLLRPLPYAGADRIVRLSELHPGGTAIVSDARLSNLTFNAWRERASTIESPAAYNSQAYTVGGVDEPARLDAASVSPSLFPLLSVTPAAGRFFRDEDIVPGASRVVVTEPRPVAKPLWTGPVGDRPNHAARRERARDCRHCASLVLFSGPRRATLDAVLYRRRSASGR